MDKKWHSLFLQYNRFLFERSQGDRNKSRRGYEAGDPQTKNISEMIVINIKNDFINLSFIEVSIVGSKRVRYLL